MKEKIIIFWKVLTENKIWWIMPMAILFSLFIILYFVGNTNSAYPAFVYSMFQ
jgi:hypothetical protein